ncbi:MAG: archaeal proteasome endopeptidase complex subunit alpha [Ignisphaera sp.]|uniref:Proteasome subunit alpha n=1 Tax=Ignisphaera aggregans TaxID=334771 RepID=A0A7J3JNE9_9CREN
MSFMPAAMGYDRALTIFSPDGKLYQVEYAAEAVRRGWTSLGLRSEHGIVLIAERRKVAPLHDVSNLEKVFIVDSHIGATFSGLGHDGRVLIDYARLIAVRHKLTFDEPIDIEFLARTICDIKQAYTQQGGVRPFGVSLIFGGIDRKGVELVKTEPSGLYFRYYGVAAGAGEQAVLSYLEKHYSNSLTVEEMVILGLRALRAALEEPLKPERVEIGFIDRDTKVFRKASTEEILTFLEKAGVTT